MSRLFWPLLLEQLMNLMIGIVSTMLVSNAGPAAVSGVSLVDQFNALFIAISNATATGTTVVIAHMIGAKKTQEAGETASQSLLALTGFACVIGVLVFFFGRSSLHFLYGGAEAGVLQAGGIYVKFSAFSYPFIAIYAISAASMRATGNSRTPLFCVVISNVVNLSLALALIKFLNLGVYAVSIAMLIARITSGTMAYMMLRRGKAGFSLAKFTFKLKGRILRPMLNIGIPSGVDQLMLQGVRVVLASFMSGMGTPSLQANSISNSMNLMIASIGIAFCYVSSTVIGQAYGARDYKRLRSSAIRICLDSILLQAIASALIIIFFKQVISLYHPTPEAYAIAWEVTKYSVLAQSFLWTGGFVLAMMLRSIGEAKFSMIISIVALLTVRLTGAWVLGVRLNWGVQGIWVSMYLDWALRCAFFIPKFFGKGWERKAEKRWTENAALEAERLKQELAEAESEEIREAAI